MTGEVHPDLSGVARWLPRASFTLRSIPIVRLALRLTSIRGFGGAGVIVREQSEGNVTLRVYAPNGTPPRGALLWMHGGGLIVGTPAQDDRRCITFARELGLLVVSPAYRLAPEHPFPAAHEDCYAAWRWTVRRLEELGVDPGRITVGGASAGGGLAAALAQRIRDEGGLQPAAQLLVYPMLDDRTAAVDNTADQDRLAWAGRSNRTGWSSYLEQPPGAPEVPQYAVPARRNDLSGLPPAWIGVGTMDLFFDENRDYAERLENAGVPCRLQVVEGAFHGFDSVVPRKEVSKAFIQTQVEFVRECVGR